MGAYNFNGNDNLVLKVTDEMNDVTDESSYSSIVIPVHVNPIDDAPLIITPESIVCGENQWCPINSIEVFDPDSTLSNFDLQIRVAKGSLSFTTMEYPPSISFLEGDGKGDSSFRLNGQIEDINFLLSTLAYVGAIATDRMTDTISFAGYNDYTSDVKEITTVNQIQVVLVNNREIAPRIDIDGETIDNSDCSFKKYSQFKQDSILQKHLLICENINCERLSGVV